MQKFLVRTVNNLQNWLAIHFLDDRDSKKIGDRRECVLRIDDQIDIGGQVNPSANAGAGGDPWNVSAAGIVGAVT